MKRRVNTLWRKVTWIVADLASGSVREEVRWVRAVSPAEFVRRVTSTDLIVRAYREAGVELGARTPGDLAGEIRDQA